MQNLDRACYADTGGLFHNPRKQLAMSDRSAEAGVSAVLVNFGFAGREPVGVEGQSVVPG